MRSVTALVSGGRRNTSSIRVEGVVVMASRMSVAEKLEIWRLLREGTSFRVIGRRLGRSDATIQQYVGLTGGVRPRERFGG